ncbi:MAG: hypothetical protein ACR2ND_12735 [Solirubrobacteraceae bacterium]
MNRRRRRQLIAPAAKPQQAAAISAALEQFMRDHAPPLAQPRAQLDPWLRAALLDGVDRHPESPTAWGDGHPWG